MDLVYDAIIKTLPPEKLKTWLLEDNKKKLIIIDVRGSDFKYGKVKGAINVPIKQLTPSRIKQLLDQYPKNEYTYVFHCMRSEVRGPKAAKAFLNYLLLNSNIKNIKAPKDLVKIFILEGGLKRWNELYGSDSRLTEEIPG